MIYLTPNVKQCQVWKSWGNDQLPMFVLNKPRERWATHLELGADAWWLLLFVQVQQRLGGAVV